MAARLAAEAEIRARLTARKQREQRQELRKQERLAPEEKEAVEFTSTVRTFLLQNTTPYQV